MSEGYNIKIGVDSRSGEQGVKSFTTALNASLKALREFDSRATNAFKALDNFGKINVAGLNKSMKQVGNAVGELNKIKVNKTVVGNLQQLSRALSGIRFTGADSLKKLPESLKGLNSLKINPNVATSLNALKAATKGFSGPPKSIAEWPKVLNKLTAVKVPATLSTNMTKLKAAMRGFVGPSRSAMNLPVFLKQIAAHKISPALASQLTLLRTALTGFTGPSARAGTNLAALLNAMKGASAQQINAIATALMRLNGLSINVGRTLGGIGNRGTGSMNAFTRATNSANNAMRQLYQQSHMTSSVMGALQSAIGGLSLVGFAKSVYETGASWQSLTRTLGSVSASSEEVTGQLQFIHDLTTRMPISIEAAATSYRKFAVAARLSGMSVAETQGVFEDFSTGFSAMGLSAESQKYAFIALEQIISKGQVQMEELKTQLGDHLPGAVQILATSLDVPVSKLMKMIEAGEVTSEAIVKMGKNVKTQFGEAAAAAVNSTQGQFVALQNSWWNFKKTIFDSDFDSALGAMANRLAAIMDSETAKQFARDIGQAFERAFRAISVVAKLLADNKDVVIGFFKAFAGWTALTATVSLLRLMSAPLMLLAPLLTLVASGFSAVGGAVIALATGRAITSIADLAKSFGKLAGKVMLGFTSVVLLAAAMDAVFNDGRATKALVGGIGAAFDYVGTRMGEFGKSISEGLGGAYDSAVKSAEEFAAEQEKIANNNMISDEALARGAERDRKMAADKLKALSTEATKLWEKLNPIGAANEAYREQIALLDEIAEKRNLTDDQKAGFRRVLDAQTLEERDPLASGLKDLKAELDAMKAKTGEQRAINDAKKFELDMLKKGISLSKEQNTAMVEYYKGIAKMNGEIGNGFERWSAGIGDFNDSMNEAVKDGIGGLSDEVANFVTGADADFAKLGQSILRSFAKIALDSMFKDVFAAMGMDGEKNGAKQAGDALTKVGELQKQINAQMVEIFATSVNVNGEPLTTGLTPFTPQPVIPVERKELPLIPGTTQMDGPSALNPLSKNNDIKTLEKSTDIAIEKAITESKPQIVTLDTSKFDTLAGSHNTKGQPTLETVSINPEPRIPSSTEELVKKQVEAIPAATTQAVTTSVSDGFTRVVKAGPGFTEFEKADGSTIRRDGTFAWRNNNPGNLEARGGFTSKQPGFLPGGGRFAAFDTLENGRAAREKLMFESPGYKNKTLSEAIYKYAPPHENNTEHYISELSKAGNVSRDTRMGDISPEQRHAMMMKQEQVEGFRIGKETVLSPPTTPQVDPMATGSIAKLNTELAKTGPAISSATTPMQQLNTSVQQTGQTAQTAASTEQMASQQKLVASQTQTMSTQQAAMGMQQAGMAAQQSGPQFMQAGVQIGQAGQAAQTAGTTAATATTGVGSFGTGIQSLLGPLASAVPGLGQFGGAILSLLGSLGGGGGGMGIFSEGGYSTSPVQTMKVPHFAEGTANTSGGMPAVLHPNEAVIPLSRGREIPVDLGDDRSRSSGQDSLDKEGRPAMVFNLHGVKDADSFKRSKGQITSSMASAQRRAMVRDG